MNHTPHNVIPTDPVSRTTDPRARARGFFAPPLTIANRPQCIGLLLVLATLSACTSGPRNFSNENDRLREENMSLRTETESLKSENRGLKTQLAQDEQRSDDTPTTLPSGLVPPACVRIQIAKLSGGVDTDNDGLDDTLRIYLQTLDARDRFVQTLGTLSVTVVAITPGQPAKTLATQEVDAVTFDAAYRSGFSSTHYTLTVPLQVPAPSGVTELTVRFKLHDLQTGGDHEAETTVPFVSSTAP